MNKRHASPLAPLHNILQRRLNALRAGLRAAARAFRTHNS